MSESFTERFKFKMSHLGRLGSIIINTDRKVLAPRINQIHSHFSHSNTCSLLSNGKAKKYVIEKVPYQNNYDLTTIRECQDHKPISFSRIGPGYVKTNALIKKYQLLHKQKTYDSSSNLSKQSKDYLVIKRNSKIVSHKRYASLLS